MKRRFDTSPQKRLLDTLQRNFPDGGVDPSANEPSSTADSLAMGSNVSSTRPAADWLRMSSARRTTGLQIRCRKISEQQGRAIARLVRLD
ncbi:hypothetical protein PGTUg99_031901 [Puccinia graminis f. sp. tritici]|uniref:Uncharacterized protein n=1 Tax=Puccinia graminis f. sp. tritici TaxID=56615 RepID=A0A5B0NJ99_PUCGR|nr:hypothetical protein PGTUg99_031901 [Puccinia graminis f. sp. tritici]